VTVSQITGPGGVADWKGWSFVEPAFWRCVDTQNRNQFTNASGKCAVADSDEFDDLPDAGGLDTTMTTPSINIAVRTGNVLVLSFDSSWRNEVGQIANVVAEFSNGTVTDVIRWDSVPGSPNNKPDATNERVAVPVICPPSATSVVLKFNYAGSNNWWWAIDNVTLFEGTAVAPIVCVVPSQASMGVAPTLDYAACFTPWSPTAPQGWSQLFLPSDICPSECGRPEWRGWAFADRNWWPTVDNQRRSEFTLASGFCAIADPDEWDDFENNQATYNAYLTSPSINLPGAVTTASLSFASSWRPEGFDDAPTSTNNQTAIINAIYTIGGVAQVPVEVLRWDSDNTGAAPGDFFHPDEPNEAVSLSLNVPANAESVKFEFNLVEARNDWWWAVDNIVLNVNGSNIFNETFETVPNKQAPPSENPAGPALCAYFSTVAAQANGFVAGGSRPGCPAGEFNGWNVWLSDAWAQIGGGVERAQFSPDLAFVSDFAAQNCDGTATLTTSDYNITGLNENSVSLEFNSGWFSEAGKTSTVEVSFNGGTTWTNVLSWNPSNKATATDEVVTVAINNPAGSTSLRLRFTDTNSGWWAISNICLQGLVGTPPVNCPWAADGCFADFNNDGGIDGDDVIAFFANWDANVNCADVDASQGVDGDDVILFFAAWDISGTGFPGC
jgi:hypothetical protein